MFIALMLAACGGPSRPIGEIGNVEGYLGGVAGEEPQAVLLARDALSAGGTAVDAMATAFFVMSVTNPAGVGLGGGGACVVFDAVGEAVHGLDFTAPPLAPGATLALPTAVRAMAMLHARFGRLRWSQLITPAERLARFGVPVSRAFARRLHAARDWVLSKPDLRRIFADSEGLLLNEGDMLVQIEVSAFLGRLRARGVSELYGGISGRLLVSDAASRNVSTSLSDLRRWIPKLSQTHVLEIGSHELHTVAAPGGGTIAHALAREFLAAGDAATPASMIAYAAQHYPVGGATTLAEAGDAGFVALDREGMSVACQFTLNGEFGSGIVFPSLGVIAARALSPRQGFVAPMLVINRPTAATFMALTASGGAVSPLLTARVAVDVMAHDRSLADAITAPRALQLGSGGPIVRETGRGAGMGRVQAIWCPKGSVRRPEECDFRTDERGYGLALSEAY